MALNGTQRTSLGLGGFGRSYGVLDPKGSVSVDELRITSLGLGGFGRYRIFEDKGLGGGSIVTGVGLSDGTSIVLGVGAAIVEVVGLAAGTSVVTGIGRATYNGVGSSDGTSTATAISNVTSLGVGNSSGVATAEAIASVFGQIADPFTIGRTISGTKKPAVPMGTEKWLKTTVETLTGRRNNQISVPKKENLTFSTPPTQEEVQALYDYMNKIRKAGDDVIDRFDS